MKKIIFITILALVSTSAFTAQETICSFTNEFGKTSLIKEDCEFPEGNKTKCGIILSVENDQETYGSDTFQKGKISDIFCIGKKQIPEIKAEGSALLPKNTKAPKAFLRCPIEKSTAVIVLVDGETKKECKLSF